MSRQPLFVMLLALLFMVVSSLLFYDHGIFAPLDSSPKVQSGSLSFVEQKVVALVNGSRAYDYDLKLEDIALRHYSKCIYLNMCRYNNLVDDRFSSWGFPITLKNSHENALLPQTSITM